MNRVDTEKAYQLLWDRITSLSLPPGKALDIQALADEFELSQTAVREALGMLVHDHLVQAPPRGLSVSSLEIQDLEQISTIRLSLETLAARQAAQNALSDDLTILQALCHETAEDTLEHFELDHRFHQAIARAAHNPYLSDTLEKLYGLSKRLWYLALPYLDFLPSAVESHIELVEAVEKRDQDRAAAIMDRHINQFYQRISEIIQEKGLLSD